MKLTITEITDTCPTYTASAREEGMQVLGGVQVSIDADAGDIDALVARLFGADAKVYAIDEDGDTFTAVVVRA